MERWQAKILSLFGLLIIPLVCTVLPIKVSDFFTRKGETGRRILSSLMCFGGGVFFAVFMLHMAPEARYIVYHAIEAPEKLNYPIADLLMSVGFFMVMFMEMAATGWSSRRRAAAEKSKQANGDFKKCSSESNGLQLLVTPTSNINGDLPRSASTTTASPLLDIQVGDSDAERGVVKTFKRQSVDHGHGHSHGTFDDTHSTRSLVLLLALSLHRVFEGMSVGLQGTTMNVWNLFIAIVCHESIIGFSLGLQFVKNKFSICRILVLTIICSLFEPFGVGIGTIVVELGEPSRTLDIINGVLQSLATGTFIYITFFEILQEEIMPGEASMLKLVSVVAGFCVMAALCAIPEENVNGGGLFPVGGSLAQYDRASVLQNLTTTTQVYN
ncbi:Zinc transporter ZIP1 [Lamellibrachia satsuma]|nr:Zinc transporter ZIP1 [Lamellibrachia satsuma]